MSVIIDKQLFLDESGECSFSEKSIYKHFLITILSVDALRANQIKKCLKRKFASFVRRGWPKGKELKASELYRDMRFGALAVVNVLQSLARVSSLETSYIVVNKDKIRHESFRKAPYGIGYNYFTNVLLSELIFQEGFHSIHLIYDVRNKETHQKRHFKEHLETSILGAALEKDIQVKFTVQGTDSSSCYGLLAVDFFSWAIFRKFEHGDDRFYKLFLHRLKRRREWYVEK